ncbi:MULTISPECIES: carbohydrate ABC transporter permease [Actinoplanes]|uniref:carbohydrate ABC transporter permease n=1 Tax=Actinoplanes TaxID=1865 RepID=UPI0005F2D9C3|nr:MULTISPECIES: carbohydrate ABC transporter permease [Actinoplanes]GLY08134.1 sugar ABC transporter permease [Actinoplanes sp. NBRC 101535]
MTAPTARRPRLSPWRGLIHLTLLLVGVAWLVPLVGLVLYSFRTIADSAGSGWWNAVVKPWFTVTNYRDAWVTGGIGKAVLNSVLITLPATAITVVICAVCAYALARMTFRGRMTLLAITVSLLVVPPQLTLVPLLRLFNTLGLTGELPSVWLFQAGFVIPFGTYLLYGFFRAFPEELLEAASLDGASVPRTFLSIVLPTSVPIIVALSIIQFMWSWNDLLVPLLFLGGGADVAPATVQIAGLVQSTGGGLNALSAAALISMIPPVVVTLALQRYFVRGILGGAVKG